MENDIIDLDLQLYTLQCLGGTLGNLLVIGAVIFRPNLRNARYNFKKLILPFCSLFGRNLLIMNLAVSDLWQCLVTMPITFTEIKYRWDQGCHSISIHLISAFPCSFWTWYPVSALCKTMPLLASVSVFVSTLSITAITLDRCVTVCNIKSCN